MQSLISSTASRAAAYSLRMSAKKRCSGVGRKHVVRLRDLQIRAREHRLDVIDESAQEEPVRVGGAQRRQSDALNRGAQARCPRRTSRAACAATGSRRTPTAPRATHQDLPGRRAYTGRAAICMRSMTSIGVTWRKYS